MRASILTYVIFDPDHAPKQFFNPRLDPFACQVFNAWLIVEYGKAGNSLNYDTLKIHIAEPEFPAERYQEFTTATYFRLVDGPVRTLNPQEYSTLLSTTTPGIEPFKQLFENPRRG